MESLILDLLKKQADQLSKIESMMTLSKTVLNLDEVCILTGLSKSHIYKLTHLAEIPHYKQSKHLYFDKAEVETWLKSTRVKTRSEIEAEAPRQVTIKGERRVK